MQAKRKAPIPKLTEEERKEVDYGYDKVITRLLSETTVAVLNIDKNQDGMVAQNEYLDVLWRLQILEGALGEHLKKSYYDARKKARSEFEKMQTKINTPTVAFTPEEISLWGFSPNTTNNQHTNRSLLFRRYILGYYRALFSVASQLKFIRGGGEVSGG